MTLLAYAIVRDADPFRGPLPAGLTGDPLHLISADGLAFACSPAPTGEPDVDRLLAFARVVQALHRMGTVLPLRFGAVVGPDALAAKLVARRAEFVADLDRLDGREEMTLRVLLPEVPDPPAPAPPTNPGTAYLLARRGAYDRADAQKAAAARLVAACRERFTGLFVDVASERTTSGARAALAIHFLVRRGAGDALAAAVRGADWVPPEARVLGPWPAYHFLTAPESLLSGGGSS